MFDKLIIRLAKNLDSKKIPYTVIGGQAVLRYGEVRLTKDIDISIGVDIFEYKTLLEVIKLSNLTPQVVDIEQFLKDTFVLPVIDTETKITMDFIFALSSFEREVIERSNQFKLEDYPVSFIKIEDLLILKTIAGRGRDIDDIQALILKNQNIDFNHVKKWLHEFDLELGESFEERFLNLCKGLK